MLSEGTETVGLKQEKKQQAFEIRNILLSAKKNCLLVI